MHKIFFEPKSEDIKRIRNREKEPHLFSFIDLLKIQMKNSKKITEIFKVGNYFHPSHPLLKTLIDCFRELI